MDGNPKMNTPELPKPQPVNGNFEVGSVDKGGQSKAETAGLSPIEMLTQAQGAVVQAVQSTDDHTALPVVPLNDPHVVSAQSSSDDNNPVIAEDGDVLEKEWVDKAKKIVASTKNDPREQTNQFVKMRYDYVKKRYGKEIALPSGSQGA